MQGKVLLQLLHKHPCNSDYANKATVSGIDLCHVCLDRHAGLQSLDTKHR